MERIKGIFKDVFSNIDPVLFVCATLLSLISVITVWGAVDNFGMSKLRMQLFISVVGIFVTVAIAYFDFHAMIERLWPYLLAGSVLLLVLTLLVGSSGQNMETENKSWLVIPFVGVMIQPSEFVKLTLTCTFAKHLDVVKDRVNHPVTLAGLAVHAGAVVGLIFLSGDYGVALIYAGFLAVMLLCAGISLWYFAGGAGAAVLGFPLAWKYVLKEYHRERIIVGFNPELDPENKGWQPLLSKDCIANGGVFGIGLRRGGLYEVLTASHTDFIFATICEKYGLVGGTVVMAILALMVLRLAVLPVIGITLPFLSCGGSSMLATYIMMGMAHSVATHAPKNQRRAYRI